MKKPEKVGLWQHKDVATIGKARLEKKSQLSRALWSVLFLMFGLLFAGVSNLPMFDFVKQAKAEEFGTTAEFATFAGNIIASIFLALFAVSFVDYAFGAKRTSYVVTDKENLIGVKHALIKEEEEEKTPVKQTGISPLFSFLFL